MDDIIIGFLVILAILLIWGLYHLLCKNFLRGLVSWCISIKSGDMLIHSFMMEQKEAYIPEEYRLTNGVEMEIVQEIIQEYRSDLSKDYFDDEAWFTPKLFLIANIEYAMLSLLRFLRKKANRWDLKCVEYVAEDGLDRLTDFGITYYKVYYAVLSFCLENKRPSRLLHRFECFTLKQIKAILDSKDNIDRSSLL